MRQTHAQRRARALQATKTGARRRAARVLAACLLVFLAAFAMWTVYLLALVWTARRQSVADLELGGGDSAATPRLRADAGRDKADADAIEAEMENWLQSDLHRCEYISSLLREGKSIGPPLPQSGKQRPGGPFYLKQPLLHTTDPASGDEVVVLRYNIYNRSPSWTQHTDKFRNTVKVLLWNRRIGSSVFPKLYGFCNDIEGYHHIVVEFIKDDAFTLPAPRGPEECYRRAEDVVGLFARVDEDFHFAFADIKGGQWMFRADGSAVLQDVDDMVPPGTEMVYPDLATWHMKRIAGEAGVSWQEMDRIWRLRVMPRNGVSVRFVSMNLPFIIDNLGFRWSKCGMSPSFSSCLRKWRTWAVELDDAAWPSPSQLHTALRGCYETGDFERTLRPPAPWRDLAPGDPATYVEPTECLRDYDKPEAGESFHRCGRSCCRAKGGKECYYMAPDAKCAAD